MEPVDISKYNHIRIPLQEKWGVIASKENKLAKKQVVEKDDLKDVPLFLTNREIIQSEISNWLKGDIPLNSAYSYNFASAILPFIQDNKGVAITIEGAYQVLNQNQICFIPFSPQLSTNTVLVWKKYTRLSPVINKFIKKSQEYLEKIGVYMKNKKNIMIGTIVIVLLALGLFIYQKFVKQQLHFKDDLTVEINGKFDPLSYISEVEHGNIKEVTCQSKNLNIKKLGEYEIVYTYKNRDYEAMIQVVDTTKPVFNGLDDLAVSINTTPDLKAGVEVSDNSLEEIKYKIDDKKIDTSKEGTYEVTYSAKDSSGNKIIAKRKIEVIKKIGSEQQSNEKVVYLTFDDGPSENTKKIMDILAKYNAKATFFVTGRNQKYNYLIKDAYNAGHTIGLHTYSHDYQTVYSSVEAYFDDLNKVGQMVKNEIGFVPHYIRFPGGSSNTISRKYCQGIMSTLTKEVIEKGYQYYDWNGDSTDASGNHVAVDKLIRNGTLCHDNNVMILCHDTQAKDTTVQALPAIIEHYRNLGYTFKGIDDTTYTPQQGVNN